MKKILTISAFMFILLIISSCWKTDEVKNIWTNQRESVQVDWLSTNQWVEKKSYSNWFTQ